MHLRVEQQLDLQRHANRWKLENPRTNSSMLEDEDPSFRRETRRRIGNLLDESSEVQKASAWPSAALVQQYATRETPCSQSFPPSCHCKLTFSKSTMLAGFLGSCWRQSSGQMCQCAQFARDLLRRLPLWVYSAKYFAGGSRGLFSRHQGPRRAIRTQKRTPSATRMLQISRVSKSYDGGNSYALRDLELEIADGETLVLLGSSGCGKSTLLKLLLQLTLPTSGQILVDGAPLAERDPVTWRRSIGYVFQAVGLFPHMTVERNVGMGLELAGTAAQQRRAGPMNCSTWSVCLQASSPSVCQANYLGVNSSGWEWHGPWRPTQAT